MSLQPHPIGPVPALTALVACAAFPTGAPLLRLRDNLGPMYDDERFAPLFARRGKPAEAPWRLALVTVLQFAERLTDRQAADAVRRRLDWTYLLGLELTDDGFDFSILSALRARLVAGDAEHHLLDAVLERCKAAGLIKPRGKQRTDSTPVVAAVRALKRLDCVAETLRATLNALAAVVPAWLRAQVPVAWYEHYATRSETTRRPLSAAERDTLAARIGADGHTLLAAVYAPSALAWRREGPAVQGLRQVWLQNFDAPDPVTGLVGLRAARDRPPNALAIESPYDPQARFHTKRQTSWTGDTVHLTATCAEETPHLITQVTTVPASTNDVLVTDVVQDDLATRDLLPSEHLLASGDVDAQHLLHSAQRGIDLVGPALLETSWQAAAAEGFDARCVTINWEQQTVTCPEGKTSHPWREAWREEDLFYQGECATADCLSCPLRAQWTRAATRPRPLSVRARAEHVALQQARQRQGTAAFTQRDKKRAGIEGTLAQGVQVCDVRHARYRGVRTVHLAPVAIAVGICLQRLDDWWTQTPRVTTRTSRFAALAAA